MEERICPDCGADNPSEAERCQVCDRALDPVIATLETYFVPTEDRLETVRRRAEQIKSEVDSASDQRLRQWWAEEEERRRRLAEAQMERDRQEEILLTVAIVFAAVVLVAIIIYALLTSRGSGVGVTTATPLP